MTRSIARWLISVAIAAVTGVATAGIETRDLPRLINAVGMLAGSKTWTADDESGLQAWMRAYVQWLLESPHGQAEAKNGNNHETWNDVQVDGLALHTGQQEVARRTLEGVRNRIAKQIEPDGGQPRELASTRSWDYSIFNLTAFFDLAAMGERLGVDLWSFRRPKPPRRARLPSSVRQRGAEVDAQTDHSIPAWRAGSAPRPCGGCLEDPKYAPKRTWGQILILARLSPRQDMLLASPGGDDGARIKI